MFRTYVRFIHSGYKLLSNILLRQSLTLKSKIPLRTQRFLTIALVAPAADVAALWELDNAVVSQ